MCLPTQVVTPFLPGDSLLFAAGSLAALGHLGLLPLMGTFITAAILGDAVNYAAGQFFGEQEILAKSTAVLQTRSCTDAQLCWQDCT